MEVSSRIRSMDTLRAIAIITVFMAHVITAFGSPPALAGLRLGGTGVDLFFVLSGWLLGGVLYKELNNTGSINIKRFLVRRWYRTLPAYYAVLLFTIAQHMLTKDGFQIPWSYFILVQNYFQPMPIFSISWSLAVEEQFYLLIAPVLLLLPKNSKWSNLIFIILIAIPVLFRINGFYQSIEQTHVRIDACLIGVFMAKLHHERNRFFYFIIKRSAFLFISSIFLYISMYLARYDYIPLPEMDKIVIVSVFAIWIIFANSSEKVMQSLYIPGMYYIATRSYAIYLLHPESFAVLNRFFTIESFLLYMLLSILITLGIAEILYRAVEIPFMRFRDRNVSKNPL